MELSGLNVPLPLALALIAGLGYFVGRASRRRANFAQEQARRELKRAQAVAKALEGVAETVRNSLASHNGSVARFKDRVRELSAREQATAWQDLCREAEEMLKPTLLLAAQMAQAYDEIRQQTSQLMTFTEVRTDPLTRICNRRALDETLTAMFSALDRYAQQFSIAIFDIDFFKQINDRRGHLQGDKILQEVARVIDDNIRDTDLAARYGGEEFVVVMPHTPLSGAARFADRLRQQIGAALEVTVSGGVAEAAAGDTPASLISRADAALYGAKAAGRNQVYQHDGATIDRIAAEAVPS